MKRTNNKSRIAEVPISIFIMEGHRQDPPLGQS